MPIASRNADDPALIALGDAMRRCRRARGISQEELAHRSAIDRSYMSSVERGGQNVGLVLAAQIARALDIKLAELIAAARI